MYAKICWSDTSSSSAESGNTLTCHTQPCTHARTAPHRTAPHRTYTSNINQSPYPSQRNRVAIVLGGKSQVSPACCVCRSATCPNGGTSYPCVHMSRSRHITASGGLSKAKTYLVYTLVRNNWASTTVHTLSTTLLYLSLDFNTQTKPKTAKPFRPVGAALQQKRKKNGRDYHS